MTRGVSFLNNFCKHLYHIERLDVVEHAGVPEGGLVGPREALCVIMALEAEITLNAVYRHGNIGVLGAQTT